ncbi:unnamed protein product (macronuclear) [Paramecium tetraurelia]|uniref:Transmembrane protein n=1 Tax=Paramecium tetraurelia TaxID=5888 RepID=A0CTL2_PARTE|nr:uncharacterized protein GSPATT00010363001 [Paramecium tetraurelia]CAK74129.1 unnamed protein product [Paramecium tetraurelia]|eukprot:XP_001441526.1 hypothetical protein (macronuclear) [Paramecium tetraurelia strain d4-2]
MKNISCMTIGEILTQTAPKSSQLWGLDFKSNSKYCEFTQQMSRLFTFSDFEYNIKNPLYQAEIATNQANVNEVFLPVCYAYSILRIFMVISVVFYVRQKMKDIFEQSQKKFTDEKQFELDCYKWTISVSLYAEIICALRDFLLFKGTILYSNVMNQSEITCYIDIYNQGNMSCGKPIQTNWRGFNYQREECNCLYFQPIHQESYMIVSIVFWIITESITQGLVGFTVLILSRLNKKESSGWNFIKPSFVRFVVTTILMMVLYSILIFACNLQIYYRFYSLSVVSYYLLQKCVIFLIIFDKLYSKVWLELKLRLPTLHSSGIAWSKTLNLLKKKILKPVEPTEQIKEIYQQKYRQQYEQTLEKYFDDAIQPNLDRYEREYNAKMKTQWYDYLNYILLINLIGIIGYLLIASYGLFYQPQEYSFLFWIGFILALVELIVFEVSNVVFQLHCFLIELYKQCEEECSALDTNQQDSGMATLFN